jgi:Ca-activated chloride channel family protein
MKTKAIEGFVHLFDWFSLSTIIVLISLTTADAQYVSPGIRYQQEGDRTQSPYFYIPSEDPSTDQLPLKSTSAEVQITGVIADVRITQVYKNEGKNILEVIYVFPASTRAAVYDMRMTIGDRTIVARIEESRKAREDYDQAKQEGKTASLLEQERPNVFQMNVANILPGDEVRVELSYTELIIPEKGIYEFVYPTVAGPRYSNSSAGEDSWNSNPYTREGETPFYSFNIEVGLNAPTPLKDIRSTSHEIEINYSGNRSADVSLSERDFSGGNRDFVLQYRLSGEGIETGILLFEGADENFFLAMVQPPRVVTPDMMPPREYVFVVDVSGSMYGYPLDISKKLLKDLLGSMRSVDRFNVILFAGDSRVLSEKALQATTENINKAICLIDDQNGSGGTEILPALEKALSLEGSEEYSRTFIIATDGYVTVEREVFELIRENLGRANFFPFGIGTSVNRYLIEGMAYAGMGTAFIATDEDEAKTVADRFREYVQNPVLSNIKLSFNGFDVYDVEPVSVPDVFSERPVIIFGKWRGNASGSIDLTGLTSRTCYRQTIQVDRSGLSSEHSAIRYLWARERIRILDDYAGMEEDEQLQDEITKLGLEYNLLTRYTSFVAIDTEVRNAGGEQVSVRQPLPLPEGVSNYAVGGLTVGAARGVSGKAMGQAYFAETAEYDYTAVSPVNNNRGSHKEKEPKKEDPIFLSAEITPAFSWLGLSLEEFFEQHIQYPWGAKVNGSVGTVYVSFVVEKNGSVTGVQVLRGIGYGCDEEAIRLANLTSSYWTPAFQSGRPVRCQMTVPVKFGNK